MFGNSDGYSIRYLLKENECWDTFCCTTQDDELSVDKAWFDSLEADVRKSKYTWKFGNCLCNNWLEHSPVSLVSWLPYSCSKCLQRDTDWGSQSYLLSACQLLDTSWSGRLGRTCVCALWFHIHSLLGSCTLCYLWWNRQGKRCSESLTNQHNRYTKVLIQLPLYFILEHIKSKQCYRKETALK